MEEHTCDEALTEGFIAGAIRGRDIERERIRHALLETENVAFHLNDILVIVDDVAGAF